MDEADKKLFEKFDEIMKSRPLNADALKFWSKLGKEEYERLIYLFENNKIDIMSDEIRLKLVGMLKNLKGGLYREN